MIRIELNRATWQYDPQKQIGEEGGFGAVYKGTNSDAKEVAVKKLTLLAGGPIHREIDMAETLVGRDLKHVVPVLDAGKDDKSGDYFVVMALAEKSLQQDLTAGSTFDENQTINVARHVVTGLLEVGDIVHRDLKPANLLFHEGVWKIADFGIARFVEASTAESSLKIFLSKPYAAPEQWLLEHATSKTDVYALGCICYELLAGAPPFSGSDEDLKQQHLYSNPPALSEVTPGLRGLIGSMLRKPPGSRPDLTHVSKQLEVLDTKRPPAPSSRALQEAVAHTTEQAACREVESATCQRDEDRRKALALGGLAVFEDIRDRIVGQITVDAPDAKIDGPKTVVTFGHGRLTFASADDTRPVGKGIFGRSGWDVVTHGKIIVQQGGANPYTWSAVLLYAMRKGESQFRWWEVCLMNIGSKANVDEPFAGENLAQVDVALSLIQDTIQLAAPPRRIDDEDFASFADDWIERFAEAIKGELARPRYLPLTP